MRRLIVGAAMVLSAACGSHPNAPPPSPARTRPAPASDPSADARLAGALRQPFSDASVEAAVEALARAGVATVADDDSAVLQQPSGSAPTKYYRAQVRNMALLASTGQGTRGADFDRFVPGIVLATKSLTMSAVVAGYVAGASTFGGRLARKLMGEVDVHRHGEYRYPTIVLALFLAEALPPAVRRPGAAADRCAASQETLAGAGDALGAVGRDSPLFAASISRAAGTLLNMSAADARGFLVSTQGSRGAQTAMAALNAFTSLQSLLDKWALEITAEPPAVHYVNHATPNDGALRA